MTSECSDNALGYKFCVLLAMRNAAKYWKDGKVVEVAGPELVGEPKHYYIYPGYAFVAYPNRDLTPYKERYNFPRAPTIIRGTLRYQGFPNFVKSLVEIGFLDDTEQAIFQQAFPWKEATKTVLGVSSASESDLGAGLLSKATFSSPEEKQSILNGPRWVGIFFNEKISTRSNPLDRLQAPPLRRRCSSSKESVTSSWFSKSSRLSTRRLPADQDIHYMREWRSQGPLDHG
jgi:saccharopine dehydrogenase (NADP+, L-glutamate forming)